MADSDDEFIHKSRQAFLANRGPTLEDVRTALHADASVCPVRRRDMLSALRRIEVHTGQAPGAIPATVSAVRELLADLNPARMGVSDKRVRNIRSSVTAAIGITAGHPSRSRPESRLRQSGRP